MNLIFLDVDGVLNSIKKLKIVYHKTNKPHSGYNYPFDEECLENLKVLVHKTNSKLVITSTWRKDIEGINTLLNVLKQYGLDKEVIGYTPDLGKPRGIEIKEFLNALEYQPNFIILDDNSDMEDLLPYLIKTDLKIGLTEKNVEEGIQKIKKHK